MKLLYQGVVGVMKDEKGKNCGHLRKAKKIFDFKAFRHDKSSIPLFSLVSLVVRSALYQIS